MEYIIWGVVFILAAALLVWLGIRRRRNARKDYEEASQRYTATTTTMTVTNLDEEVVETWVDLDDGSRELRQDRVYTPTFKYTVDGKPYQYTSRRAVSGISVGQQFTGYYDPRNPADITEIKPRKPVLGGFLFFAGAAFLLFFAVMTFAGEVYIF